MADRSQAGHRQRLRDRFMASEESSHTDEALLELLLSYAIPQKDCQLLARKLIAEFGTLAAVLATDVEALCTFDGIKAHTAVLLKLTDWIRTRHVTNGIQPVERSRAEARQATLFDLPILAPQCSR